MHKQFSGGSSAMQTMSFFMCVMVCFSLRGMDGNYGNYDFAIQQVIIPNTTYDYYVQRKFAVINTVYNKIIEEHYRPNKKEIKHLMAKKGTPIIPWKVAWNKDFSKCAWTTITELNTPDMPMIGCGKNKRLDLRLLGLVNKEIIIKKGKWYGYKCPAIEDNIYPFFNDEGSAVFQFYAEFIFPHHADFFHEGVLALSVNLSGYWEVQRCLIEEDRDGFCDDFYTLLNLPVLMKAILQSTHVRSAPREEGDLAKLYSIVGVTIPENYKLFKSHTPLNCIKHGSYNDMDHRFRRAIDKQYQEQQREKEKQRRTKKSLEKK